MTFFRSQCLESGDVVVGDDPTDQQQDVLSTFGLEEVDDPRDEYQVGPGEQRETEGVRVFLDDGLDDLLGRLVQSRVDDLETGVAKGASDDLGATVVPIKTGLGDDDSVRAIHGNIILGSIRRVLFSQRVRLAALKSLFSTITVRMVERVRRRH